MVITSVYDRCAGRYLGVQSVENVASAVRGFRNAIKYARSNPDTLLATNPSDFDLYLLGEFDGDTGVIDALLEPECVCTGAKVIYDIEEMEQKDE